MGPSEKVLDICNIFYSEQKVAGVILFLNYKNLVIIFKKDCKNDECPR